MMKIIKDKKFKYIFIFWLVISIQFVIGANLQNKGYSIKDGKDFAISVIKIILLTIIFVVLQYCCLELKNKIQKIKQVVPKDKEQSKNKIIEWMKQHKFLVYFLIIIVCWIPTLLAFYPVILSYDGRIPNKRFLF